VNTTETPQPTATAEMTIDMPALSETTMKSLMKAVQMTGPMQIRLRLLILFQESQDRVPAATEGTVWDRPMFKKKESMVRGATRRFLEDAYPILLDMQQIAASTYMIGSQAALEDCVAAYSEAVGEKLEKTAHVFAQQCSVFSSTKDPNLINVMAAFPCAIGQATPAIASLSVWMSKQPSLDVPVNAGVMLDTEDAKATLKLITDFNEVTSELGVEFKTIAANGDSTLMLVTDFNAVESDQETVSEDDE